MNLTPLFRAAGKAAQKINWGHVAEKSVEVGVPVLVDQLTKEKPEKPEKPLTPEEKIARLRKLREADEITEEQFQEYKKTILDAFAQGQ